ncbi:major facilitator superfamily domain-containing protein [Penicillium cataractarum]|uniref:Major facilitator superfamily domain-containing protein n=1 Tax=Penicillium cataractarum TaxID=2100454 RepID=A0A9W9VW62_9EURO|nr:major facilitator superfamily domain-containing protein [Penicillium cataractarum]KAJ5390443.1 major facilitator superfamily domain-containing protein [Penicillium cataractarum]
MTEIKAAPLSENGKDLVDSLVNEEGNYLEWSEDEEKALRRKLDFFLMPLLIFGLFVLQLDRSNISNALSNTIAEDLHITSDQVNFGSQLSSIGIIISEIPANLILQKLGASVWLTAQMLIWGTIALTQTWCTNIRSFYATRFLLGLFEGGYLPGAQYILALFYTRKELARRTAIFYFGNYGATATGSLIAAGVLQMAGIQGLSGWQWLFLLEGTLTLLVFMIFAAFLPRSPTHTALMHGRWDFFSDRERFILRSRVVADDDTKGDDKVSISLKPVLRGLVDYRLWIHMILNIVSLAPKGGLQLYGPTIIKSLGFSTVNANLLNAVSSVLVIIFSYLISLGSDRTNLRGPWCIIAFTWSIVFSGALFGMASRGSKWTRYSIFTLLAGGNALAQGLNDAWVNINATSSINRSLGLAMAVMGSNIGGLAGQQLFRSSDAPMYTESFLAILLLYIASIPVTLLLMWVYWRRNKAEVESARRSSIAVRRFDL